MNFQVPRGKGPLAAREAPKLLGWSDERTATLFALTKPQAVLAPGQAKEEH